MLPCRFTILRQKKLLTTCINYPLRFSSKLATKNNFKCIYPPITDMSDEGILRTQRQKWYDIIQSLPTVEEKLYELNLQLKPKLDKFTMCAIPDSYVATDFHHYITRTHNIDNMPNKIHLMNVDEELNEIKDIFCEELKKCYAGVEISDLNRDEDSGSKLVKNFISQCFKKLCLKNDYILNSTVQTKPRIKSFWWHGGFPCEKKDVYNENLCFTYADFPSLTVRLRQPLSPMLPLNDPLCATADVNNYNYHPTVLGTKSKNDVGIVSVPGYWPGDPCEYPFLLVYPSNRMNILLDKIEKYSLSRIEKSVASMSSFAWLNAVATYQGFTPFHDITYPIVTHTIVTNGQDWRFFVYQLNTVAFHADVDKKNRRNILWSSKRMRLFDAIEDGQVKGINEEVFRLFLKFLLSAPDQLYNKSLVLKPYLSEDVRTEEEKTNMGYFFRRIYSEAPDMNAHKEEIPHWQRIYKLHPEAPPSPYLRVH